MPEGLLATVPAPRRRLRSSGQRARRRATTVRRACIRTKDGKPVVSSIRHVVAHDRMGSGTVRRRKKKKRKKNKKRVEDPPRAGFVRTYLRNSAEPEGGVPAVRGFCATATMSDDEPELRKTLMARLSVALFPKLGHASAMVLPPVEHARVSTVNRIRQDDLAGRKAGKRAQDRDLFSRLRRRAI
ncbi:hypothetical protein K490DRAFT_52775 [Saccharata proteae CBS 121410]|uniref:Uncharacterized protein n=1 Tax=Saccharata proteae CBS 121410 TaxID=1314787 RepID=A0A9P4HYI6_9PEZI|nr:hypothetical protein K490DRAFT_52775 [Saccharata proteae CBS 121410]